MGLLINVFYHSKSYTIKNVSLKSTSFHNYTFINLLNYWRWCSDAQSCLTLRDPKDCSPPGSSVHGITGAGCHFLLQGSTQIIPKSGIELVSLTVPPILKEIGPGCSLEGMMLKLKLQYFGHLMWRVNSLEKTLMLGGIGGRKRRGRQRMRWLDGSPTRWTWVWVNSRSWWWTGRPWHAAIHGVTKSGTQLSDWTDWLSPALSGMFFTSEPPGKLIHHRMLICDRQLISTSFLAFTGRQKLLKVKFYN